MATLRLSWPTIWNAAQFQLGWFALVVGASGGLAWWGVALVLVFTAIHLQYFACLREWRFLLAVSLLGWLWETLVWHLGLLHYADLAADATMAPVWMALLWLNFATTINHSLAWLRGDALFAALMGAVGGPLAFLAGEKLGAVTFASGVWTTLFLAVAWAILTPAVFRLAAINTADGNACLVAGKVVDG